MMSGSDAGPKTTPVVSQSRVYVQACKLTRIDGPGQGEEFTIEPGETIVGSSAGCTICVPNSTVSRQHFSIRRDEQTCVLTDLGSTNGTSVGDFRVEQAYLRPGALIKAGEVFFRFELDFTPVEISPTSGQEFGDLSGSSKKMRQIFAALEKIAPTKATVLIYGETGTGKGAVARAIHHAHRTSRAPFVVLDCGAVAPTLVESKLFGHERGAFTGATHKRAGALEEARGGTLFIDELSDLSLALQPKLLRALEERQYCTVGGTRHLPVDCRVIAATQKELWNEVLAERFRRDLYFRLAVVTIRLPPLRERREDIPLLTTRFLEEFEVPGYRGFDDLPPQTREDLLQRDWPGNIRELRNVVERLGLVGLSELDAVGEVSEERMAAPAETEQSGPNEREIELAIRVSADLPFKRAKGQVVDAFTRKYLTQLLKDTNHNIAAAARQAGIVRRHFYTLLKRYGFDDEAG